MYSDPAKPGCYSWGGQTSYCYTSCSARQDVFFEGGNFTGCDPVGCDWTTCVSSDAFNTALLDALEDEFCLDVTREYATGQSNGVSGLLAEEYDENDENDESGT